LDVRWLWKIAVNKLVTMKKFIQKYWKTYLFFVATMGVAFLVNGAIIKPRPPHAGISEAGSEVKSVTVEFSVSSKPGSYDFKELANIPKQLISEPKTYVGSFLYKNPQELLNSVNAEYDEKAIIVETGVPAKFGVGYNEVLVFEPQNVFYDIGGTQGVLSTWAGTVNELITQIREEKGVMIGEGDVVDPPRDSVITKSDLFVLNVTPVENTQVEESEKISFKTIIKKDPELEKGKKVTEQAGQLGKKVFRYDLRREMNNDKWYVVAKDLVSSEVVKEPVDEVIVEGTKIILYGTGKATFYNSKVAAHKELPFGTKVRVVNLANGKETVVTIGDRGPFGPGRIIDLPTDKFAEIASVGQGIIDVRLEKVSE